MYAPISIHHKIETKEKAPTMKGFKIKLSLVTRTSIRNKKNTKKTNALVVKLVDTKDLKAVGFTLESVCGSLT